MQNEYRAVQFTIDTEIWDRTALRKCALILDRNLQDWQKQFVFSFLCLFIKRDQRFHKQARKKITLKPCEINQIIRPSDTSSNSSE